jgi:hypothetical protein
MTMATGNPKTIKAWDWDVRVRERNLKNGTFEEKDLEKHLTQLQDVGDLAEPVALPQPSLGVRSE